MLYVKVLGGYERVLWGEGNSLRGHQRILKSEIIVNLIDEAPLARAEGKVREHANPR